MERIGTIVALYIRKDQGSQMEKVDEIRVDEGGIIGDIYHQTVQNGYWQELERKNPKLPKKKRGWSAMDVNDLTEGNQLVGSNFTEQETRRNIIVDTGGNFIQYKDSELQFGEVKTTGLNDCKTCNRPSELSGKMGFEKFKMLGGIRGDFQETESVITIKRGDPVFVV